MTNKLAMTSQTRRFAIENLENAGIELSDEQLQLATGGMIPLASYERGDCTFGQTHGSSDTDFHRVD
jgi:hypothetical protein